MVDFDVRVVAFNRFPDSSLTSDFRKEPVLEDRQCSPTGSLGRLLRVFLVMSRLPFRQ